MAPEPVFLAGEDVLFQHCRIGPGDLPFLGERSVGTNLRKFNDIFTSSYPVQVNI